MTIKRMTNLDLRGKRLLIRQDLNVPLADGEVSSDARIRASIPTIKLALDAGAAVIIMSHLGRPTEGVFDEKFSLGPVAKHMGSLMGCDIPLVRDWNEGVEVQPGQAVMLENVRFNEGEKADEDSLAKAYAALCDVYVMDAFGTAHRAQASTHGAGKFAPIACAGPLLSAELDALGAALKDPARPLAVIVGGSKVSTKLELLESLAQVADRLILGGGIANTFLAAAGHPVGKSLYEEDLIPAARKVMAEMEARGAKIPLPTDVVCATEFSADAPARTCDVSEVGEEDMILDVGPDSAAMLAAELKGAGTIVWNGPVGVFEMDSFAGGTQAIAQAIAESTAFSLAGGGDTLAAIDKFNVAERISYISTGGGAFLEFLEGKTLPAVALLEKRSAA